MAKFLLPFLLQYFDYNALKNNSKSVLWQENKHYAPLCANLSMYMIYIAKISIYSLKQ